MKTKRTILLVDDHPVFLKGLVEVLQEEMADADVHAYTSPAEALKSAFDIDYDIAILDLDMPVMNGLALSAELKLCTPGIKIMILTMHKESDVMRSITARGVDGYVLKDDAVDELVHAIDSVWNGAMYISELLSTESEMQNEWLKSLTKSELLILKCISENKTSREISEKLFVSIKTVENHRTNISKKLNLRGSNSLLKFALSNKRFL